MKDNNNFEIRQATEKDVPAILNLILELAVYEKLLDEVVATEESLREWVFEKGKAECLMAEQNGKPVGYALFFHNFSTFLGRAGIYLEDIYVTPESRGLGLGKALFEKVAEIAVERQCGRLEWCCLDWNKPSIDFYLSMEAEPLDEWTLYRLSGDRLAKFGKQQQQ